MRRWLAVAALALAGCVPSAPPPPSVYVYGDSLTVQSIFHIKSGATIRARSGTALCSWTSQMRADAQTHPKTVVLAFVGNYPLACHGSRTRYDAWRHDLAVARLTFGAGTKVIALIPTVVCNEVGNVDVAQAVTDSGLPTLDARAAFGDYCPNPYLIEDGIHLTEPDGRQLYADVLGKAW